MSFRHRRRVDWDEEMRKTDNIQRRGFAMSFLSFVLAAVLIFGSSHVRNMEIQMPFSVVSTVIFAAVFVAAGVVIRRYLRSKNQSSAKSSAASDCGQEDIK